ncbi:MAG: YidC/Oxa1 family membrane protein insertase [Actinomycetota bacterium]
MLAIYVFQVLLNSIGWLLAKMNDMVGSYGLSIIILTVAIKVVLLPLGIKQIKSMQAMQAIQPKVKELQKKYKGNKQRIQEETMKLYKDAGVNPLGGCLPTLLQLPILVAMYAVIRPPQLLPVDVVHGKPTAYEIHNDHLPVDSQLFQNVVLHDNLNFLGMNLQCSAAQSGTSAKVVGTDRQAVLQNIPIIGSDHAPLSFHPTTGSGTIPCGSKSVDKIPYFVLLAVMIGTMFYQQRQMQRASPPGAASQQQQTLLYLMPVMFGVIGFAFPAGLTLYWTISNVWTIGQQFVLLKAGHIGPEAMERRMAEQRKKTENAPTKPAKQGFMARMQERAEEARRAQPPRKSGKPQPGRSGSGRSGQSGSGGRKPTGTAKGSGSTDKQGPQPRQRRPNTGNPKPGGGSGQGPKPRKPGTGGSGGTGDGETRE